MNRAVVLPQHLRHTRTVPCKYLTKMSTPEPQTMSPKQEAELAALRKQMLGLVRQGNLKGKNHEALVDLARQIIKKGGDNLPDSDPTLQIEQDPEVIAKADAKRALLAMKDHNMWLEADNAVLMEQNKRLKEGLRDRKYFDYFLMSVVIGGTVLVLSAFAELWRECGNSI